MTAGGLRKLFILLGITFLCLGNAALAAVDDAPEFATKRSAGLNEIDRSLALELIKFSRFNCHFHLESNWHQPWRNLTYAMGREAGTATSFGGNLTELTQKAKGLSNLNDISKNAVRNAISANITGNAISGSASSLELVQNTWAMWKAKRDGFSPKASVAFVREIMASTDVLFAKRQQLILREESPRRKVHEMESEALQRLRQQLLLEFLTWSVHSRDQAWRENTFYAIDALDNFTRMTSGILAREALTNPQYRSSSVVCALIANSALTLNPIIRNMSGLAVAHYQKHKLAKEFSFTRPVMPSGGYLQEVKQLQANYPGEKQEEQLTELLQLGERSDKMDRALQQETKEIARYRQIAQQQSISGPMIGLTALANSILSAVALYDFRNRPVIANRLTFAGRISHVSGQAYALVNTPYTMVNGMIRHKRKKERGELPEQVLEKRLANLDNLEQKIKDTAL